MATNPDPVKITNEMWRLWEERPNKSWKLGGIYADKKGYHNTVLANKKEWPDNYSIRFPLDLVKINNTKARAVDLTMSTSEMIKWTTAMKASAENPADNRLDAVREFYGTLDGKTVFGMIKDSVDGPWRKATADISHTWHGHQGFFTAFVANWAMLAPSLSVWAGQTYVEWSMGGMLPRLGDKGEIVEYWQRVHNSVRNTVSPPSPLLKVDSEYGPATAIAFADFWEKSGGEASFKAPYMPGWLGHKYHIALAKVSVPVPDVTPPPVIDPEQLASLVDSWLSANVPVHELNLTGTITGKVTL